MKSHLTNRESFTLLDSVYKHTFFHVLVNLKNTQKTSVTSLNDVWRWLHQRNSFWFSKKPSLHLLKWFQVIIFSVKFLFSFMWSRINLKFDFLWCIRSVFKFDELGLEIARIALPAALALTADPIASLVDTAFIGQIGINNNPRKKQVLIIFLVLFQDGNQFGLRFLVLVMIYRSCRACCSWSFNCFVQPSFKNRYLPIS